MKEKGNKYGVFIGKSLRNRLSERLKRSEDNTMMDLKQIGCEDGYKYLKVMTGIGHWCQK
jgi:hypothetical protein